MKKGMRKIPVDVIYPKSKTKLASAVDSLTGVWYIHKGGKWIKSLTKYANGTHPPDYPRYVGKLSIYVKETRIKFKDLPEGATFRLDEEFSRGISRRYYKYYFNKHFNAESYGDEVRVKIDKEAFISDDGYAGRSR